MLRLASCLSAILLHHPAFPASLIDGPNMGNRGLPPRASLLLANERQLQIRADGGNEPVGIVSPDWDALPAYTGISFFTALSKQ